MFVSDSPERWIGWPLRTSAGPPPTASVTVDQSGGNETRIFTGAPTGASFASSASSLPRATRTAPLRGIGTALRLTVDVTVPVRSWNGVAGGNGDTTAASAFNGGVDAPPPRGKNAGGVDADGRAIRSRMMLDHTALHQ